ncbi:MAG: transketolase family protein [Bacteroidales bacterium]|nr:transketolase family protein [Bacteroidales bacterium]
MYNTHIISPMKNGFGQALAELGEKNKNIVCLGTDITKSVGMNFFKDKFPDRFFSLGIAEQNTASVAAGLALSGKIPVFSTYAVFSSMRSADQIRVSICYNNLHVIIGGAHAGISVGPDGATHQALEDIAVMRSLPNMTVLSPCDENQTKLATISAIKQIDGPCYIRYGREPVPNFTDPDDNFIVGKAKLLRKGKDISIIATGSMVYTALMVADELEKIGISASVLNIHTIKPIDSEAIIKVAQKTKKIVSLEEHQIFGGLGSAVAEVLSQNYPVKLKIIGMPDCFGESGNPEELLKKYGLDPKSIFEKIINFINN